MLTSFNTKYIMPNASTSIADAVTPWLNQYLPLFKINTPARLDAFLAQIAHESGELKYMKEIWGPTKTQLGYEGRKDLGNNQAGDGMRFMGRGLIQLTGRANYVALGKDTMNDASFFTNNPQLVETPKYAVLAAVWFWNKKNLNKYADKNDFKGLTKKINGGYNGYADRVRFWKKAKLQRLNPSWLIQPGIYTPKQNNKNSGFPSYIKY